MGGHASMLAVCAAALGLSGCGWFNSQFHIDPVTTGAPGSSAGGAVYDGGNFKGVAPFDLASGKLVGDCDFAAATKDVGCRNRLMDHLVNLSELSCTLHKSKILGTASGWDLTFSSVTTSLGGAGAIVTGVDAARGLAGAAGITSGLHSGFRENIYHNNLSDTIVRQIDRQRAAKLQQMMALRSQPVEAYTPEGMLGDVSAYHGLCSFSSGVAGLGNTDRRASTADELRGRIRSIRQEIADNDTAMNRQGVSDKEKANLTEANEALTRMLTHLVRQLSVVMASEGGMPAAIDPTPGKKTESAPAADKPAADKPAADKPAEQK